ncbi:MAG: molybdopterin-dependent oxidoreductase [Gammaproteobacteria bacterium]
MAHKPRPRPLSRRDFMQYSAALAGAATMPGWISACSSEEPHLETPVDDEADLQPVSNLLDWPLITDNADFFQVDTGAPDVPIDSASWSLAVSGLVDNAESLSYDQLLALPAVEQTTTLVCIGNPVGGAAIGTARWRGVALSYLLSRWGVQAQAHDMVARDVGTYSDSIPLSHLQSHFAMLAYEMNGVPLPHLHGAPLRIIVPGIYGIKNVKWVAGLEFVDSDYQGYWQQLGWPDSAHVRTLAQIRNVPDDYRMAPGVLPVNGFAYAGLRGIQRVEISADGGQSWIDADLDPPLSPYAWVRFEKAFVMDTPGAYRLRVRATDAEGVLQEEVPVDTLNGSEGWHSINVIVV